MSGSLITLPLRLSLRATGLAVRGAREIVERAAGLAGLTHDEAPLPDFHTAPDEPPIRIDRPPRPTQTQTAAPRDPDEPMAAPRDPAGPDEPALVDRGQPIDYDAPAPAESAHIDTEDEIVEEVAEPGAEDGAGAQVRVAEPWSGYRALRAADVINRLAAASSAELAAIELYELSGRKRRTVIAAAQRELTRRG